MSGGCLEGVWRVIERGLRVIISISGLGQLVASPHWPFGWLAPPAAGGEGSFEGARHIILGADVMS